MTRSRSLAAQRATVALSIVVRRTRFGLALRGIGADELFGGYPTFQRHQWVKRLQWLDEEHRKDKAAIIALEERIAAGDSDRQVMTCLDPQTGTKKWQGNLGVKEIFRASPTNITGLRL